MVVRLMGLSWRGNYFLDLTLSFGGASCCAIFSEFGDFLTDLFARCATSGHWDHYLDDFITVQKAGSCAEVFQKHSLSILDLCTSLNIPLAAAKTVFPSTLIICIKGWDSVILPLYPRVDTEGPTAFQGVGFINFSYYLIYYLLLQLPQIK